MPTGTLSIFTSTDGSTGSKILLNGHDVVGDDNGGIKLVGQGTYGSHTLMIGKNGLQADGKQLVRSVDGVNANANGNVNLNGKYLPIGGGTITGALTVNGNSVVGGRNVVRSVNGVTAGSDGNVSISTSSGRAYITSTWDSGVNWYRRYSDGFIEQGGRSSASVISFHTSFRGTPMVVLGQIYGGSRSDHYGNLGNVSTTNFSKNGWDCYWYACGF